MNILSGVLLDEKESEVPVVNLQVKSGTNYGEICFMGDFHIGCLPGNELVGDGYQIASYKVGDFIISRSGIAKITRVYCREPRAGEKLITINALGILPLRVTENHPVLVARCKGKPVLSDFRFARADSLHAGDWLLLPRLPEYESSITLDGKQRLRLNYEIARFLGGYTANGYCQGNTISLCFDTGRNEDLIKTYSGIIQRQLNRKVCISKDGHLRFTHKALANYLRNLGGKGERRISHEVLFGKREHVEAFFNGFFETGNYAARGNTPCMVTTSKVLAYQCSLLSSKMDGLVRVYEHQSEKNKVCDDNKKYHIELTRSGQEEYYVLDCGLAIPIISVKEEPLKEKVWNLETEDHTFAAPVIVHNSGNFSLGQYLEYLAFILKHPEIKVGLMGDLIEMGSLSPFGASEEKVGALQLLDVVKLLEPIKDRIIFMLEGNHEERFWRATKGTDSITKSIADALRITPLLPGPERGQLFMVKVGKQVYSVYAIHGSTSAVANKASQLSKIFANLHTSLAVHGHNHQIFKDHRTFYGVREVNGKYYTSVHEQYWLSTGCFVKNLGYAEAKSMPVTKIGAPFVRFYADREAIEIIDDPRITYAIGEQGVTLEDLKIKGLDRSKYEERSGFGGTELVYKPRWKEVKLCKPKKLGEQVTS